MISSELDIANMALNHLGVPQIQSWDGPTLPQRQSKFWYHPARIEAQSKAQWNFNSGWAEGIALDVTPKSPWTYVFAYPPEALNVFEIQRSYRDDPAIPFEVTSRMDAEGMVIHTDAETPTFIYGRDFKDISKFDPAFTVALSYLLANKMCMPITKNPKLAGDLYQRWLYESSLGRTKSLNEGTRDTDTLPAYQAAR